MKDPTFRPISSGVLLLGSAAILLLLTPVLTAVWISFSPDSYLTPPVAHWSLRWYERFATDPRWLGALGASLAIAVGSSLLALLIATPAALSLRHLKVAPRRGLTLLLLLPALLPPTAIGCGLLPLFQRTGLWGTHVGLVLAHAAMALPIALLLIHSGVNDDLARLEATAAGLGARPPQIFWRITGPTLRPVFLAAGIVGFVLSLNDSLVTLFLVTPKTETLPALLWPQLRYAPTPLAAVASTATMALSLIAIPVILRRVRN